MPTLGIDLGTSGVRACVMAEDGTVARASVQLERERRRDPQALWAAVRDALAQLDLSSVAAIAVDGTSGTILPVSADGEALGTLSLYDDVADPAILARVRSAAPETTAASGATSPLARAIGMLGMTGLARVLHEADWVAGRFSGVFDATDENNALKTGYDPVARAWPDWIEAAGMPRERLPRVAEPGSAIGRTELGAIVAAGTTDGCASFLAAGADRVGDAVTALGSTLSVKLFSETSVCSPRHGVYSHRLNGRWLAGGSSNSGGAALARHFSPPQLEELSARIDPAADADCDYHPLPSPGERFPVDDPRMESRETPRPADDAAFLHGLLDGIAKIEADGYRMLERLGASPVRRVFSVGGGATNATWTAIRARRLGVQMSSARSAEAADGAALLARRALVY